MGGGVVPLHGRAFSQWMHFVFPHDCPYPFRGAPVDNTAVRMHGDAQYAGSSSDRTKEITLYNDVHRLDENFTKSDALQQWSDDHIFDEIEPSGIYTVLRLFAM